MLRLVAALFQLVHTPVQAGFHVGLGALFQRFHTAVDAFVHTAVVVALCQLLHTSVVVVAVQSFHTADDVAVEESVAVGGIALVLRLLVCS